MTRRALLLLSCLLALGCQSEPTQTNAYEPQGRESLTSNRKSTGLGAEYRDAKTWKDSTQGAQATFIYISLTGSRGKSRPYPVIYSSDPNNTYFYRENTPQITVRRLHRDEMSHFFALLEREGFNSLPWEEHGFTDRIGADRGFYVYRDGRCERVLKADLEDTLKKAFTRVENRVIAVNSTY